MKTEIFDHYISASEDTISSFLSTILGDDAPFEISSPSETTRQEVQERTGAYILIEGEAPDSGNFAVLIETGWLTLVSVSMLGGEMTIDESGAEDLLRQLSQQAYSSLRSRLSQVGLALGEVSFKIFPPGSTLSSGGLPQQLVRMPFKLTYGDNKLGGLLFFPMPEIEEDVPEPASDVLLAAAEPAPEEAPLRAEAPKKAPAAKPRPAVEVAPAAFPELGQELLGGDGAHQGNFNMLAEVELEITVELGRRKMPLADVLKLTTGSVVELDKLVGEPLEIYANGRLIAEGEAVVIDDQFGIRITSLATYRQRARAFAG